LRIKGKSDSVSAILKECREGNWVEVVVVVVEKRRFGDGELFGGEEILR
jgi:coenzyme F420-reducing hydrogenase beta subunit